MAKPIPLSLEGAYVDHNGCLVDHLVKHNENYGDESQIAKSIATLFRKHKTADTHYPVNMNSRWYPEYTRQEINSFYKDEGVEVIVRGKTRIDLAESEDGNGRVHSYTISYPFWYIVYLYCSMYGVAQKSDMPRFMHNTKAELKNALKQTSQVNDDTHINHDVFAMIGPYVINIGS